VSADRFGAAAAVESELQGEPVAAPVAAGQEVGRLVATVNGESISSVPVLAAADVAPSPVAAATRSTGGRVLLIGGGAFLAFLGITYGTTAAKSARRRRRRLQTARRAAHRVR
jgi:hypothetical protein